MQVKTSLIGLFLISSLAYAGFEQESNNTKDTATPLTLNELTKGAFNASDKIDYYKFTLKAPQNFILNVKNAPYCGGHPITFDLYDSTLKAVNSSKVEVPINETRSLNIGLKTGDYYLVGSTSTYLDTNCPYEFSLMTDTNTAVPVVMSSIVDSAMIKDINNNGSEELVFLKIKSTAKSTIEIKDPKTKLLIREFQFTTDSRTLQPIKLTSFSDINGDGLADIGVLALNRTTNQYAQYFYNATTGIQIAGSSFTVTP